MSSKRGFTLIELLVVISIIALLVSILMPALAGARRSAKRIACAGNLRSVGQSLRMYLDDNNDFMPVASQMISLEPPGSNLPSIGTALKRYIGNRDVLQCPGDNEGYFQREETSYEYPSAFCGKRVNKTFLGKKWGESKTPVMFDFETFHNESGSPGAMNFLFGDGHVGKLAR